MPGGLAFSEFEGYEGWHALSMSRSEKAIAITLGNPVMIEAYRAGIPANGRPVPDGAKMAKIHWTPKANEFFKDWISFCPAECLLERLDDVECDCFAPSF